MPEFGEIMAELRQDAGMTQQDLALELFVSKSSISNFETGQRRAHTEIICRAANVFHVSTDYLLGLTEISQPFSIVNEVYIKGTTVGSILEQILALDEDRRHTLCALLNDMQSAIKNQNEGRL